MAGIQRLSEAFEVQGDWQLPLITKQYYHAKVSSYLPTQRYFVGVPSVQNSTEGTPTK